MISLQNYTYLTLAICATRFDFAGFVGRGGGFSGGCHGLFGGESKSFFVVDLYIQEKKEKTNKSSC